MNIALNSKWNRIMDCAINLNHNYLVSACDDGTLKVFSLLDNAHIATLSSHNGSVRAVRINVSGKLIVSCSVDRSIILWDFDTFEILAKKESAHNTRIFTCAINSSGDTIVSCSEDGIIKVWSFVNSEILCLSERKGHSGRISSCSINEEDSVLVTGGEDKLLKVWSLDDLSLLQTISDNYGRVLGVDISASANIIISTSSDSSIRVYFFNEKSNQYELSNVKKIEGKEIRCCSLSASKNLVLCGAEGGGVFLWDFIGKKELIENSSAHLSTVRWCKLLDSGIAYTGSEDSTINIYDKALKRTNEILGHSNPIQPISYQIEQELLVYSLGDSILRYFSFETQRRISIREEIKLDSRVTSILTQKSTILIGLESGKLLIISKNKTKTITVSQSSIQAIVNLEKSLIFIALSNGDCSVFDLDNEKFTRYKCHENCISDVQIFKHAARKFLFTFSVNGKIKLWEVLDDNTILFQYETILNGTIWCSDISKSNDILIVGMRSGKLCFYKVELFLNAAASISPYKTLSIHDKDITCCSFYKNDDYIVTSSFDKSINIIKVNSCEIIASTVTDGALHNFICLPDESIMVTGNYGLYGFKLT